MIGTDQTRSARATLCRTMLMTQTKKLHAAELAKATKASCHTGTNGLIAMHRQKDPLRLTTGQRPTQPVRYPSPTHRIRSSSVDGCRK